MELEDVRSASSVLGLLDDDENITSMVDKELAKSKNSDKDIKMKVSERFDKELSEIMRGLESTAEPDSEHMDIPEDDDKIDAPIFDAKLAAVTNEAKKQKHIDTVLKSLPHAGHMDVFDRDKDDDDKAQLLDQISMLRKSLEMDSEDLSSVEPVSYSDSVDTIRRVYKTLKFKNERCRCSNMANEMLIGAAYMLESLFDGKNEFFGRKPDLTGWPDHLKVKLRRMKYETASLVQDMIQGYNMPHAMRMGMEILPSMIIYTRDKSKFHEQGIVQDATYKEMMGNLNSISS